MHAYGEDFDRSNCRFHGTDREQLCRSWSWTRRHPSGADGAPRGHRRPGDGAPPPDRRAGSDPLDQPVNECGIRRAGSAAAERNAELRRFSAAAFLGERQQRLPHRLGSAPGDSVRS